MDAIAIMLFHMTEWLRTTWVVDFSLWLEGTAACNWLQSHFYAIPAFQTVHIIAIAILFGSTLMLNLRVLGVVGMDQTLAENFRRYLPWILGGLAALVVSGTVLLVSEPVRNMVNPIFWLKMGALLATVLVSLWYHLALRHRLAGWEGTPGGSVAVRSGAVVLIGLWMVVMIGGRWIAYAPV